MGGNAESPGRVASRIVYAGRVFDVRLDRVRFPDGSAGELEIIRHPGAAAVLPYYPNGPHGTGPRVVLLKQYRYAAGEAVWEVPAGKLDPGESPEACAGRELEEEAGLRPGSLRRLTTIHTTPGFTDEVIHLFLAVNPVPGAANHEASEFIERHEFPLEEALRMVKDGEITDSKTICTLLYAAVFELDGP